MLFDFTAKIKSIQFLLLSLRWYLIVYMLIYGIQKIALNQFGVYDQSILQTPLEDVDTFYIAWFLFQKSVFFNISTGFIEFLAGILLIFNRTVIIGALLTLTVLIQIFILDTAFTTETLGYSLPIRLGGMIFCNLIILYSFRKRLFLALSILTKIKSNQNSYKKWWIYVLLVTLGIAWDFIFMIITYPLKIILIWINN